MKKIKWKGFINSNSSKGQKCSRNTIITPSFIDININLHDGKNFTNIQITEEMVGHKLGEFLNTRRDFVHKPKKKQTWVKKLI